MNMNGREGELNQLFSQWDDTFCNSMMTISAVDRLVHHALIFDIQAESFRRQTADKRSQRKSNRGCDPFLGMEFCGLEQKFCSKHRCCR
ncbi:ATP-binding protein [Leptolyngbya sp. FACHB-402]|nr:ATP-binding protein [Leptolyngbya sp. FACHB-161]MBD2378158.1 ATP-binding protein [Leptolyngbya sp. FACHB-238]MBD2402561.1 ATP-binding protein [Leptolyngbya sp. FACHB-239]MBD2409087.1 ATP-binding protein [Leptolyngbya sp. FACHB-402]